MLYLETGDKSDDALDYEEEYREFISDAEAHD